MKTSSTYPVLDNRPIDQWKVTELKEELKRRKLTIKGLKDDLVRRLDEALRNELESIKEDSFKNNLNTTPENVIQNDEENDLAGTTQPLGKNKDVGIFDGTQPEANFDGTGEKVIYESMKKHDNDAEIKENSGCDSGTNNQSVVLVTSVETKMGVFSCTPQTIVQTEAIGIFDGIPQPEADSDRKRKMVLCEKNESIKTDGNNAETKENSDLDSGINDEGVVLVTSEITNIMVKEVLPGKEEACDGERTGGDDVVKNEQENSGTLNKRVTPEIAMDVQVTRLETEVAKPPLDDVTFNSSDPDNQVSEVSSVLGFQLKTDSNSSDSVATNKKNELKDNVFDDNVNKLELDVKTEMVHPSSSNVVSDGSEPHPMDVEEPCDKKKSVKERDEKNASLEISKKNDSLDLGSSEKLILDRSSGDDSMDDDDMENKPINFSYNSGGVVDQGEKIEGSIVEEAPVAMPDDVPGDKKEIFDEIKKVTAAPSVKRKNDQEAVGNNESSKRQRKWNTGSLMVFEPQSDTTSSTMPKETLPTPMLKRNFSKLESTTGEETPKERVVPPSPKPPTTSLRIDRFLRPFTLKAVQELLGKTGSVTSFWMDHIKTHCYVTYSSVEEAVETRNAVYNLQWPPNGGRLLLAEFVDPQEVKTRSEAAPPPFQATPVGTEPTLLAPTPPTAAGQPPRQQVQRQQNLQPPPSLPPSLSNPPQARERLPPPPPLEKIDTPIVTLDDLFRKTKATPRIYYLPLTDEQVVAKRRNIKQ